MRYQSSGRADFPAVGDWVVINQTVGVITDEQILATNVNTIFFLSGLDRNFNVIRIER